MSFKLQMLHYTQVPFRLERIGITNYEAHGWFDDDYRRVVARYTNKGENRVVFNLGRPQAWWQAEPSDANRFVSLVIGPVVSPTGRPVGVLAALREVHEYGPTWTIEQLKEFERALAGLREDLYATHLELISADPKPMQYERP